MQTVTVTETPSQDQYAPSLSRANDDLRKAVARRNERHATAPLPPVAEAACDVTEADCCQGSRMPTLTKTDHVRAVPAAQETAGIFTKLPGRAER